MVMDSLVNELQIYWKMSRVFSIGECFVRQVYSFGYKRGRKRESI